MSKALVMLAFMTSGYVLPDCSVSRAYLNIQRGLEPIHARLVSFLHCKAFRCLTTLVVPSVIPDVLTRRRPIKTQTAGASAGLIRFSLRGISLAW
jgi:hypothetical protein